MDPTIIDWSARPAEFISAILPDIIFKFTDGEVAAHKTVLVMVSRVFRDMLIDHNTLDMEAKEIAIEDCRKQSFQIMIDAINNAKLVKESLRGKSMEEMFAVLYVVTKYEIRELELAVKECVSSFPITEDNVLEVATNAMEFLDTFEEPARNVLVSCAKFLERRFTDVESFIRDVAENGDRIVNVHKLAEVVKGLKMAKNPDFLIATEKTNGKSDPAKEELLEKNSSNEDADKVAKNVQIKKGSENEAEETEEEEDGDVATEKTNGKSDPAKEELLEKDSSNEDTDEVAESDHIEKESENEAEETKEEENGDVATKKTNGKSDPAKEELLEKDSSNEDADEVAEDDHIRKESENEAEAEETKEEEDGDDASENNMDKNDADDEDVETIDEVESDSVLPLSEEADTKTKPDIGDDYDESKERKSDENEEPEKSSENQKPQKEPKKMKDNEKVKNSSKCYKCGDVGHYARECLIEGADKCFNCKEEGHKSKQCKKPKPCYNCHKHGHHSRECPEPKKPKNLKRTAKDGDDEATAPKRKKSSKEEKRKCFTRGKTGHSGHSYVDILTWKERVCHNCREVGHKKEACSTPKKMGCFKCGQEGHMAYRCKSAKTEEISME